MWLLRGHVITGVEAKQRSARNGAAQRKNAKESKPLAYAYPLFQKKKGPTK